MSSLVSRVARHPANNSLVQILLRTMTNAAGDTPQAKLLGSARALAAHPTPACDSHGRLLGSFGLSTSDALALEGTARGIGEAGGGVHCQEGPRAVVSRPWGMTVLQLLAEAAQVPFGPALRMHLVGPLACGALLAPSVEMIACHTALEGPAAAEQALPVIGRRLLQAFRGRGAVDEVSLCASMQCSDMYTARFVFGDTPTTPCILHIVPLAALIPRQVLLTSSAAFAQRLTTHVNMTPASSLRLSFAHGIQDISQGKAVITRSEQEFFNVCGVVYTPAERR